MVMVLAVDNTKDNTKCSFCDAIKWKNPDVLFIESEEKKGKVICSDCAKEATKLMK